MGLTSFFKRKTPGDTPASAAPTFDAVERVRTRTRQRLIGAVVLLTIGVIGFPLVFESQPRPIPVDIPIEIPRQDAAPALVLPTPRREAVPADASASRSADGADATTPGVTRESPADPRPAPEPTAGAAPPTVASTVASGKVEVVPAKPASAAESPAATRLPTPAAKDVPEAAAARTAKVTTTASPDSASPADAAPASAAEASARFVVQVGAFADPVAARELRSKVEKLGLKTYTQVAETSAGKRIRVRLGPFATRAEADKVQARAKEAGIAAVVLTL